MARAGFQVTIGQSLGQGQYSVTGSNGGAARQESVTGAALAAAIADAVAVGAGDASVEVAAVDAAYAALVVENAGDVAVTYDTSKVSNLNQLRRALDTVLRQAQASGMV